MKNPWTVGIVVMCTLVVALSSGYAEMNRAIRPISNFVYFDSPDVGTVVHPIFVHHEFPSKVNTTLGDVPLDGDLQLYALQLEVALSETLSFIAVKDGWVDFNPDNTDPGMFSEEEGLADLAAGFKWVFHKDEDKGCLASVRLVVELPTGDDDVWQGNGDGRIDPAVSFLKFIGDVQLVGTLGYIYAIDDDEGSSSLYDSWHVSYNINDTFFPLVELNHFMVTEEGGGAKQFDSQVGGGVPSVARFEGPDLVNLGSSNADDNEHQVTLALGCRARLSESVDIGAAYEFPLTDEEDGLLDSRITIDLVWNL